jgi:hypothetical protein
MIESFPTDPVSESRGSQILTAAAQITVLQEIEKRVETHFDRKSFICCFDTLLYEHYEDTEAYYAWCAGALQYWLLKNSAWTKSLGRYSVFRFIFLPQPNLIRRRSIRYSFLQNVMFNAHLHLWHGVVVCLLFLDPSRYPPMSISKDLNITSIPDHDVLLGSVSFYGSNHLEIFDSVGSKSHARFQRLYSLIRASAYPPFWLWYDQENYSYKRIVGGRWETLRELFRVFEPDPFVCPMCRQPGNYTLDHILPVADRRGLSNGPRYQTLLNFSPLCHSCNSSKQDQVPRITPFSVPEFVPLWCRTDELRRIINDPPPWLGSVSHLDDTRMLTRIIEGFKR